MESLNPHVNALHQAFCNVSGQELPMLPMFERDWLAAHMAGLTTDDVTRVFKERMRGVHLGERRRASLLLRAFCGSEEAVAWIIQESAAIKSRSRIRLVDPSRQSILKQTGREEKLKETPAKPVGDVNLMESLRKAAE